jgi:hypothetical protein
MAMLLLSLLLLLVALTADHAPVANGEELCSLNGEVTDSGVCRCDRGWRGPRCAVLDLGLSTVVWPELGGPTDDPRFNTRLTAAWGGSILGPDSAGAYHLYEDVICQERGCMHTDHAQIVHAVSTSGVKGPYRYEGVAIPPEMENVQAIRAPSGEYLLYYLDHADQWTPPPFKPNNTCTGALDPAAHPEQMPRTWGRNSSNITQFCAKLNWNHGRRLGIAVGASPSGPFELIYPQLVYDNKTFQQSPSNDIECGINPSAFFHPNGTVLLVYRYDTGGTFGGETLVAAVADHYRGPYRVVATAKDFRGVVPGDSEDPFVWMTHRGFHVLYHNAHHGCHAWSKDFLTWHGTGCGGTNRSADRFDAYNFSVAFEDGHTLQVSRRERPGLLLDKDGAPTHFLSGVQTKGTGKPGSCRSWTVLTELNSAEGQTDGAKRRAVVPVKLDDSAAAAVARGAVPAHIIVLGELPELTLAAKDAQRYVYATTGSFLEIERCATAGCKAVQPGALVLGTADMVMSTLQGVVHEILANDSLTISRIRQAGADAHGRVQLASGATVLVGATPLAVRYATYDWVSADLGVYFAIDGDRIPRRSDWARRHSARTLSQPRFEQRGAVP